MDALADPYTAFFATASEEGGTVFGLAACMLTWFVIGALVGKWWYVRSEHRQQKTQKTVTLPSNTDEEVSSIVAAPRAETPAVAPVNRRERAKAMEAELKAKKQMEEEVATASKDATKDVHGSNVSDDVASEDWSDEDDEEESETDSETAALEELRLKMVLIIRKDEPMLSAPSIATKASQAALAVLHATLTANQRSSEHDVGSDARATAEQWWQWYLWWNQLGVTKIALKCPDRQTLSELHMKAVDVKLPCALVDGDILAVGPAPSKDLDVISGALKLLN
jgi:peptidyl-tRNA hydrolase